MIRFIFFLLAAFVMFAFWPIFIFAAIIWMAWRMTHTRRTT